MARTNARGLLSRLLAEGPAGGGGPARRLLLAELLVAFVAATSVGLRDPERLFRWIFGSLPALPWPELLPWISLVEGVRNLALALAVGCLFVRGRAGEPLRTAATAVLVTVLCVIPVLAQVELRINVDDAPGNTAPYVSSTNDGGVHQVEMASEAVLSGENPYRISYDRPPASRSPDSAREGWRRLGYDTNPALDHLTYPPGPICVSIPFLWASRHALGFYDQRIVYLLAAFALALVLASMAPPGPPRRMVVVATLASPLLGRYLENGRSDILVLLPLAVFGKLLLERRWLGASIALGVALTMKQFALFALPFLFLAAYLDAGRSAGKAARRLWPSLAVPLAVMAPFLVWDAGAMIEDVFLWLNAGGYPVRWNGFGLTPLAYGLGLVREPSGPNPYGFLSLPLLLLSAAGLGLWVYRKPTPRRTLVASGALLYVALFTARAFAPSYLASPVLLWAMAWLSGLRAQREEEVAS